jgi:hypothetical protein
MAGDEILWKKIDELKQREKKLKAPEIPRKEASGEPQPGRKKPALTGASMLASNKASKLASKLASYHASMLADIRKAVKQMGKEVSFVRLTVEEKQRLADIVYSFKRQGTKTSENELLRIALNFLLNDYEHYGKESILVKTLKALHT